MTRCASLSSLTFGAVALLALSACGLRGDLERPEPMFGEPEASVEAELATEEKPFEDDPQARRGPRFNEFGGEIPEAAPVEEVEETPLTSAPVAAPQP